MRRLLAQRDMKDITHIGVARVPADGRPYRWRWGILAVHRSIRLPGFPSHGPAGATLPLQFRLLGKLDAPEVWVLPPGGRVRRLPVGRSGRGRAFAVATIPLGPRRGALWVEIVGHGPLGPEVAANFPVFVGETPPRAWTGFAPPDESWVHTAAQAETLMTRLVNADRSRFGLAPLEPDALLARIARAHSRDMAAHGYFGHTSPREGGLAQRLHAAGYTATWCGENIAEADSIAGAEADLMRSPGHRANILAMKATHLGIGIVGRTAGRGVRWLITQEFARPVGTLPRAGFRSAVRRLIAARRGARGLPVIPASDALDGIAGEMAARVATGRVSGAGRAPAVATRLRQAGITFRRLEVVTYRVPGPDGMKLPGFLFDRGVNGIGIGVNRSAPSPLTIVVLIVTLDTR
ncbi:MAG: CAP domain-containing protein [Acidobacteria bacterium]|nr:CAP domain-containing protein [Acidobacteriota bacterium]